MPARPEPGEPGGDVFGRDADGAGQRGGGQGVGEPGRATRADVGHPASAIPPSARMSERGVGSLTYPTPRSLRPERRERAVDEHAADDPELPRSGLAQRHPDPPRRRRRGEQRGRRRVVDPATATGPRSARALAAA